MEEVKIPQALIDAVEEARLEHNAIPWWKTFKRQDAASRYKYALLAAAYAELDEKEKLAKKASLTEQILAIYQEETNALALLRMSPNYWECVARIRETTRLRVEHLLKEG